LAAVRLLEVLLPPQPENAIATKAAATATGPSFIAPSLIVREIDFPTKLGDLPALGVASL
jgi:hypothetical protein